MREKILRGDCKWVIFFLRCRNEIFSSWKHLPHGADSAGNMFDTVDNLFFVIAENNIAVLAHNLNNKMFYAQVAKLVKMLDLDIEDALKTGLGD